MAQSIIFFHISITEVCSFTLSFTVLIQMWGFTLWLVWSFTLIKGSTLIQVLGFTLIHAGLYFTGVEFYNFQKGVSLNIPEECIIWAITECVGNKGSNYKTIDGNDTSHDNWNDGLHDQLRSHHRHGCNTCTRLRCTIGSTESWNQTKNIQLYNLSVLNHNKLFATDVRAWH